MYTKQQKNNRYLTLQISVLLGVGPEVVFDQ